MAARVEGASRFTWGIQVLRTSRKVSHLFEDLVGTIFMFVYVYS